jgi:menaquinone-dependent protoporphyrinogen IX oxidase
MTPVPTRTLVAYITAGGATERYAQVVAETLRSSGHAVDVVNLKRDRVADLSLYENVVVGTGVRMGLVYRAAKQFLRRKDLVGKKLAVFLSSGIAIQDREKARGKFLAPLVSRLALAPLKYDAFPGSMPGTAGRPDDRTDVELARQWATELAARLNERA